jgi:hypothetical protein
MASGLREYISAGACDFALTNMLVSRRKWKAKLKDWGFDKHLSERDMKFVVAKAEKRSMEEGKETEFFHNGSLISNTKIGNCKRRKTFRVSETVSPSVGEFCGAHL